MSGPLVLHVAQLREAVDRALAAVEAELGREVILTNDHYWQLPVADSFNLDQEPRKLTVGQLTDDLASMIAGGGSGSATWHDLAHLIGLLRHLEHRSLPSSQ